MEKYSSTIHNEKFIFKKYIYQEYGDFPSMTMSEKVKEIFQEVMRKKFPEKNQIQQKLPKQIEVAQKKFDDSFDYDDLQLFTPYSKEDIDVLADRIIPDILKEGEKNFQNKYEEDFLRLFLKSSEIDAYNQVKSDLKNVHNQHLQDDIQWKKEIDELKKDFSFLIRKDINNYHKKYELISGKAELWKLMRKKIDKNFLPTINHFLSRYDMVLHSFSEILWEHFSFYVRHAGIEIEIQSPKNSQTKLEKLKNSKSYNKNSIMYWYSQDYCSCNSEELSGGKNEELEAILKETHEKLRKVTEPYLLLKNNLDENGNDMNLEENLYNLIKRFQKYRIFVKTALPKYDDFLESLENLMIFELAKVVQKYHPDDFEGNYLKGRGICDPCHCEKPTADNPHFSNILKMDTKLLTSRRCKACCPTENNLFGPLHHKNFNIRKDFINLVNKGLESTEYNDTWNYYFEKETISENVSPTSSEQFIELFDRESFKTLTTKSSNRSFDTSFVDNRVDSLVDNLGIVKSKLMTAKDSLTVLKTRDKTQSDFILDKPVTARVSLKLAVNSLTLLRRSFKLSVSGSSDKKLYRTSKCQNKVSMSKSMSSTFDMWHDTVNNDVGMSKLCKNDSLYQFCEFLNGIFPKPRKSTLRKTSIFESNLSKKVQISCIELLDTNPEVRFADNINLISTEPQTESSSANSDYTPYNFSKYSLHEKKKLSIAGDPNQKEPFQNKNEFLIKRIDSLFSILRKNQSLFDHFQLDSEKKSPICVPNFS